MNSFKLNSFRKFACLVLTVVLVISTVGFAKSTWQIDTPSNITEDIPASGDGSALDSTPSTPTYYSVATGLEISEEQFNNLPLGIVVDPTSPLYGISLSDLMIEFPTEDGTSRMLTYTTSTESMRKIGSIRPTRSYISEVAAYFGGTIVSYGRDGIISSQINDTDEDIIDISKFSDCYYTEASIGIYTDEEKIAIAQKKLGGKNFSGYNKMPFEFSQAEFSFGQAEAKAISIPYSSENETQLYYNELTDEYLYYKSGNRKTDMLTGRNISYKNIFILFSNAVTYENSSGTELILDTASGGMGYYISSGKLTEFKWSVDQNGTLEFNSLNGDILKVDRGNSYITYFKASNSSKVRFS